MTKLFKTLILSSFLLIALSGNHVAHADKTVYLDLMQKAVEAYTPEQIEAYIDDVDRNGIKDHGFARLTSNMGIIVAHGLRTDLLDTFTRLMDLCAREIPDALQKNKEKKRLGKPSGETGNDFALREISCCLLEVEKAGILPKSKTDSWRAAFTPLKAKNIYTVQPKPGNTHRAYNWCVYGAASECARIMAGLGGDRAYADKYLTDQLRWFDENGMYMDPHQPMVYDFVTRLQFMAALSFGYDGPAREGIEKNLLLSALPTLQMQSVTGEIPYGGRSNQFLHNETFYAAVCEYYASWMKQRGEDALAARFKAAAERAVNSVYWWLSLTPPVRHIKNRYPVNSGYGCEGYGHFNKYMVTMGSWCYLAYSFADDSIKPSTKPEPASTFVMSDKFHRICMNAGGYTVEFDLDAQKEYDSSGLGRIQKAGAPCVIALASPCPASAKPNYKIDVKNDSPLAIAPLWERYELVSAQKGKVVLSDGGKALWTSRLSSKGLAMNIRQEGDIVLTIPVLDFDGESRPQVECGEKTLSISFRGWKCVYSTDGAFSDTGRIYGSRNGHMRRFEVHGHDKLSVCCMITEL